jgi:hypothetical protein
LTKCVLAMAFRGTFIYFFQTKGILVTMRGTDVHFALPSSARSKLNLVCRRLVVVHRSLSDQLQRA